VSGGLTLDEAAKLLNAAGVESPRTEARLLLAHVLGVRRDEILSAPALDHEQSARFAAAIARRAGREPLAYITGVKEFWSMEFRVGLGVLVPRPDSETLIDEALLVMPDRGVALGIADLGTGSGSLLIAVLKEFPNAQGLGFESSPAAFGYAFDNAERLMPGRAEMRLADWTAAPRDSFDLILCNPPYIPAAEIDTLQPEVSRHEPRAALDGGPDGLAAYRVLAGLLPGLLKRGGRAILEIGAGQADAVEPLMRNSGLKLVRITPDLTGVPRAVSLEKA
jgi:release factor glutamine methyltransferase